MTDKTDEAPDFESTLAELEQLVSKLERGDLSLNESLEGFKHGIELTRQCQSALDKAEQTVEILTRNEDEDSAQAFAPDD